VPPVLVELGDAFARPAALPAISRLLLSGRPVQVIATVTDSAPDAEGGGARLSRCCSRRAPRGLRPSGLGGARRGARRRLRRAIEAVSPGLHLIDVPPIGFGSTDRVSVAAARIAGRVAPLVRYEPDAGPTGPAHPARDNPELAADWASEPLPAAPGVPAAVAVTSPTWRCSIRPGASTTRREGARPSSCRSPSGWRRRRSWPRTSCRSSGLLEGRLVRLVVDRWSPPPRATRRPSGARSRSSRACATRCRGDGAEGAKEREALAAQHAKELEKARAEAGAAAVERVVAVLVEASRRSPVSWAASRPRLRRGRARARAGCAGGEAGSPERKSTRVEVVSAPVMATKSPRRAPAVAPQALGRRRRGGPALLLIAAVGSPLPARSASRSSRARR